MKRESTGQGGIDRIIKREQIGQSGAPEGIEDISPDANQRHFSAVALDRVLAAQKRTHGHAGEHGQAREIENEACRTLREQNCELSLQLVAAGKISRTAQRDDNGAGVWMNFDRQSAVRRRPIG